MIDRKRKASRTGPPRAFVTGPGRRDRLRTDVRPIRDFVSRMVDYHSSLDGRCAFRRCLAPCRLSVPFDPGVVRSSYPAGRHRFMHIFVGLPSTRPYVSAAASISIQRLEEKTFPGVRWATISKRAVAVIQVLNYRRLPVPLR